MSRRKCLQFQDTLITLSLDGACVVYPYITVFGLAYYCLFACFCFCFFALFCFLFFATRLSF